jgi:fucose 4-O-acetylase-like acetyltransferase
MRDIRIDFLRSLGLALVILAHVQTPTFVKAIRCFDVPLMVLMSGISYSISTNKDSYISYVIKRFKRLILPTWLFLSLFFLIAYCLGAGNKYLNPVVILSSYNLTGGIGFVWIIRVFFIVAVLSPVVNYVNKRSASNATFLLYTFAAAIVNEILLQMALKSHSPVFRTLFTTVWDGITYTLIFALGLRLYQYTKKEFASIMAVALIIVAGYGYYYFTHSHAVTPAGYKYPPTFYYVFYSVLASFTLWLLSSYVIKAERLNALWVFMGSNTLWIYFWHIVMLTVLPLHEIKSYLIRYVVVVFASLAIYWLHYNLFKKLIIPKISNKSVSKTLSNLFIG